ncbi:MAG TPA: PIG-L deacetylase family protein [Anaerolineaceae bacterium]|nr:PIG-L deacetylase family protein [Anaerolineaceae bacterium]
MEILAFFAHPDDETMLAGGTLALLARLGHRVHYLCATRGEGGEMGDPPLTTREELGAVREKEMVCAVGALGGVSLTFLDYIDPTVGPEDTLYPYADDLTVVAGQAALSIREFQVEAVMTHGAQGEYGHPAHVLTHQAARLAVESFTTRDGAGIPALYTVQANFPEHPRPRLANKDIPAHLVIDVGQTVDQKLQAALCYRTQHALFVRRPSREAGRTLTVPEVMVTLESLHRVLPPVQSAADLEGDPLFESLLDAGATINSFTTEHTEILA